jgi:hypothetical protein
VPVGSVRPGGAALVEPGAERTVGQLVEPLSVAGDGDAPVGQVQVVQQQVPDGCGAGGVDRGQGDDQPLCGVAGGLFDGADLGVGHRQQVGLDVVGFGARGGVGKDQAALLGVAEQRP